MVSVYAENSKGQIARWVSLAFFIHHSEERRDRIL